MVIIALEDKKIFALKMWACLKMKEMPDFCPKTVRFKEKNAVKPSFDEAF